MNWQKDQRSGFPSFRVLKELKQERLALKYTKKKVFQAKFQCKVVCLDRSQFEPLEALFIEA
jgi:hypothetical protein